MERKMKRFIAVFVAIVLSSNCLFAGTWADLNMPNSNGYYETYPYGISGSYIVGAYWQGASTHGFLYNMNTNAWTTLDYPSLLQGHDMAIYGISGDKLVGSYEDSSYHLRGFLYNMTTQTCSVEKH